MDTKEKWPWKHGTCSKVLRKRQPVMCMWWDYNVNGIGYCRETNSKIHASFSDCPACSRYINNKTEVHSTCER